MIPRARIKWPGGLGWHSSIKRVDESIVSIFYLEMLILRSAFVLAFVLPTLIGAKTTSPMDSNNTISPARTPGKLRVVENSGVCGGYILTTGVSPLSL